MRIAACKVETKVNLLSKEILSTSSVEIYVIYFDRISQSTNCPGVEGKEIVSLSQTRSHLIWKIWKTLKNDSAPGKILKFYDSG